MITEALMSLALWLGTFVLGFVPDGQALDITTAAATVADLSLKAHSISAWFPWGVAIAALLATYTGWALLFVVKIVRQLLAHVPQIGGTG